MESSAAGGLGGRGQPQRGTTGSSQATPVERPPATRSVPAPPALLSAKEWCIEVIRGMIYTGELAPGEKVLIEALSRDLSVSRTPVRDALWHLQREGLVDVEPRVGVFVRSISPREIADIYALKEAFEPLMAHWAAQRGSDDARRNYRDAVADLVATAQAGDVARYIERLHEVREQLLALAGSEALTDMHGVLDGRVRLLRFRNLSQPGQLLRSAEQHTAVAQAILAGDATRAAEAMREHMRDAGHRIRSLLESDDSEEPAPATATNADDLTTTQLA